MFIEESDVSDIIVYYKKVGKHYLAYNEKELAESDLDEEAKKKYKKVTIKMRQLTWGAYNDLQEASVEIDGEGNRRFNFTRYKELKLIRLIVDWDATTLKDGEPTKVKVSKNALRSLSPEIAEAILSAYDEMSYVTEEEEGN